MSRSDPTDLPCCFVTLCAPHAGPCCYHGGTETDTANCPDDPWERPTRHRDEQGRFAVRAGLYPTVGEP